MRERLFFKRTLAKNIFEAIQEFCDEIFVESFCYAIFYYVTIASRAITHRRNQLCERDTLIS